MPNERLRKIIGKRRRHFYESFKFNKCRGETQHNTNYNKIITTLLKKWIKDHKQQKNDMQPFIMT
jgi:hypothetical protein